MDGVLQLNEELVNRETEVMKKLKKEVDEKGISAALLGVLIFVSIVTITYGSVYIHESDAKNDTEVNWPLFWMAQGLQYLIIAGLALATYKFASRIPVNTKEKPGTRRLGTGKYVAICVLLFICSTLVSTGVYNAIATPNIEEWKTLGMIFGSVLVGIGGIIAIGLGVYFVKKSKSM